MPSYILSHHTVRLARTSLSISKNTCIVTFKCRPNNISAQVFKNLSRKHKQNNFLFCILLCLNNQLLHYVYALCLPIKLINPGVSLSFCAGGQWGFTDSISVHEHIKKRTWLITHTSCHEYPNRVAYIIKYIAIFAHSGLLFTTL